MKGARRRRLSPQDNPVRRATVAARFTASDAVALRIANLLAAADARSGKVDAHTLRVLEAIAGAAQALAARRIGPEVLPFVHAARGVLRAVFAAGGRVEPQQADTLAEMVSLHDAQIAGASVADYAAAVARYVRVNG